MLSDLERISLSLGYVRSQKNSSCSLDMVRLPGSDLRVLDTRHRGCRCQTTSPSGASGEGVFYHSGKISVTPYTQNSILVMTLPIIPALRRLRQEDCEFKAILGYIESLGMACVALWA